MDLGIPPLPQEVFDHCGLKALDVFSEDAADFFMWVLFNEANISTEHTRREIEREPQ